MGQIIAFPPRRPVVKIIQPSTLPLKAWDWKHLPFMRPQPVKQSAAR